MVQEHLRSKNRTERRSVSLACRTRLMARSSEGGGVVSITVLIQGQGSDTKLVGQMQPYGEARSLDRQPLGGHAVPPCALQR